MWIISINGEDPVTSQGALNKLQRHQTQLGKTNLKVSIFIRKSYKRKNIEDIRSIFDQVRPVVSHLEVIQPWKPLTPNNIVEAIKDPKREYWKEALFVQYEKNKNFSLILYPIPITSPPPLMEQMYSVHSMIQVSRKDTVMMHGNLLHATLKMGIIRLKVLILISPTVLWYILTPSE